MDIAAVLTMFLRELNQPVISDYELYLNIFHFYQIKKYREEKIENANKIRPFRYVNTKIVDHLIQSGIISKDEDFPQGRVFKIVGNRYLEAGDVACSVDPFAYISHLSAMAYHGLTNRLPKMLFISTPHPRDWSRFARIKMKNDIGEDLLLDYDHYRYPKLVKIRFDKIQHTHVTKYSSVHHGAFKKIQDRKLRVSTIGRTFLDMLREPEYCGGMRHIMEIFAENGLQYKNLIIDEIDRHGTLIEKTRAGYLLEEYAKVHDEKIDKWATLVERGGSRKLDAAEPYSEKYSPRWSLSLNIG